MNSRYLSADVVISLPTMATDAWAGIGGAVENLGWRNAGWAIR